MADQKKEAGKAIDLRNKKTLYAPKGAPYHAEGQEVKIHPTQEEKFKKMGFTPEKPKEKGAKDA